MKGKGLYPGCLAMIVGAEPPENNRLVVTCVALVGAGAVLSPVVRAASSGWHIHNEEGRIKAFIFRSVGGEKYMELYVKDAAIEAKYLLPLGGPDLAVDTDTAKPKEVPTKEDVF